MTDTFFVADVGNTRIKIGICAPDSPLTGVAVPPDEPDRWRKTLDEWQHLLPDQSTAAWAVAGVHPGRRDRFADWLRERGHHVRVLADYREVPIRVDVETPENVGIDRLLNAVVVVPHIPPGLRAAVIDAGSAVTVDLVEREGVFRGGAIFPGLRLMAKALQDYTAQLPLVEDFCNPPPSLPGRNTVAAIAAGIHSAVFGGIERIIEHYEHTFGPLLVAAAGGDAKLLRHLRRQPDIVNPWLTLEGIRLAAQHRHDA